ncbi:MAG: tRNA pseudouridine(55) synthase TruB [Firmicutes bacterium]|nr:tRNA pseudouridine(55) synthase TruB [Lachnospiraceae bacterium]MDD6066727.1 tRNA pseudouridine(55) synthase TruB [Bacillota bacterium]MDY2818617.1 tRNA pseudouridine(55) synthase TruB [Hominisplanchenecus sp.]
MNPQKNTWNGILNVYKEQGYTSHDVVAKLRGILKQKKIGHTGTLDPAAEGVLPVCLGKGTRLCELLTDKQKTYRAVMLLGRVTDTQDTTGQILEENEVLVTEEQVTEAVLEFKGDYDQIPPMYSALKVDGKKLCDLARAGKTVERKARRVQIIDIQIEKISLPRVTMTVTCSKGTYIRTLCHDIGIRLGCGACMEKLLRTRVSCFELKDSLKLSQIQEIHDAGELEKVLIPLDAVFLQYPAVRILTSGEKKLKNGNPLEPQDFTFCEPDQVQEKQCGERFRVYGTDGTFAALYEYRKERELFFPLKMFI